MTTTTTVIDRKGFEKILEALNTDELKVRYLINRNFSLPLGLSFSDKNELTPKWYDIILTPDSYTYNLQVQRRQKSIFNNCYPNLINIIRYEKSEFLGFSAEINSLMSLYENTDIYNKTKPEEIPKISTSLSQMKLILSELELLVSDIKKAKNIQKIIENHEVYIDCGCESCSGEYVPLKYYDLEKMANKFTGFQKISIYAGLSENKNEKSTAIRLIEKEYISKKEKMIRFYIEHAKTEQIKFKKELNIQ